MGDHVIPSIRGLNHITLAVSDLDTAVRFHRDVLGLTLLS